MGQIIFPATRFGILLAAAFLHYAITAILPFEGSRPASPRATFVGQLSPVCAARQKHHSHAATPVSRKQFPLQGLCSFFPLREASWTRNPLAFSNSVLTLNPWSGRHHAQLHRACSPLTTRRVATNGILGSRAESDSATDSNAKNKAIQNKMSFNQFRVVLKCLRPLFVLHVSVKS